MFWIKIHTKLLDWEWASCPETMALWIHILLRANYEDKRWQGITIPRGSFVTSVGNLASTTGLSAQQVRTSLKRLISTSEITSKSTNRFTIITVCKYDSYQLNEELINKQINEPNNNQATNEQQTDNKQITTTADIKNTRHKESISSDIDEKVSELESAAKKVSCQKKDSLDTSFVDEELRPIFLRFLEMRKKIGKPLKTPKGIHDRYNNLIKLSGGDTALAIAIAEQTLSHEWQDFYELKNNRPNGIESSINNGAASSRSEKDFSDRHYDTTLSD